MAAENSIDGEAIVMGINPKIAWQLQLFAGIITLVLGAILAFHPTFSLGAVCVLLGIMLIVGGIFVIETLSVIVQVGYFKLTGKRVLACSPLHNHFVFKGEPETRIVIRFWIGAALLAMMGVASLKIR